MTVRHPLYPSARGVVIDVVSDIDDNIRFVVLWAPNGEEGPDGEIIDHSPGELI